MNIVLLGFMGTGKTVVGKIVARKLKMVYVDIDEEIEKESKLTISQIFSQFGEEHFRGLEKKAVLKISQRDNQVISAGGGIVLNSRNIETLRKNGLLFCLDARVDVIFKRTRGFTHRPLLEAPAPLKAISEILKKREKNYARIKNHIDTSDLTPEEVGKKVIVAFRNKQKMK